MCRHFYISKTESLQNRNSSLFDDVAAGVVLLFVVVSDDEGYDSGCGREQQGSAKLEKKK